MAAEPPPLWGCPAAPPPWASHPGRVARGAVPWEAIGGPCQYAGVHKGGAGEGGRGGQALPAVTVPPVTSRVESSPLIPPYPLNPPPNPPRCPPY